MGSKARVLIVDDSRPTVTLISAVLKKDGYEVHTAFDGKQGLEMAQDIMPNLIILDIMMPEMNGYEVAYHLKRDPDTRDIGVLMLSAKGGVEEDAARAHQFATKVKDRMKGFDVGAVDFLTKPVKAKELAKRVKALLWAGGFV